MRSLSRSAIAGLLLLSVGPAAAQDQASVPGASSPARICLDLREVQRTETPDDRTILFHMRDGKIWRNTLKQNCPMLRISPYTQVLQNGERVCANQQFIHVLQTGNTCTLGEFTPLAPQH